MSTRRDIKSLALAAVAAAALLSGCGDDDGGSTDETSAQDSQPLASWIKQADQICAETVAETEDDVQRAVDAAQRGDQDSITEVVVEVTIPSLREQFERIGELAPPEGKEDEAEELVAAGEDAVAQAEENPDLIIIETGRPNPFDEPSEMARDIGLKVCGN